MRALWLIAVLWASAGAAQQAPRLNAPDSPDKQSSMPATGREASDLQDYGKALGKAWLKESLNIDLDALSWSLRRRAQPYTQVELQSRPSLVASGPASESRLLIKLDQYDDLRRLAADWRDIPVAVRFEAFQPFGQGLGLETRIFIPLSWKDELRAEARLPLPYLGSVALDEAFGLVGLESGWMLHGAYTHRLGASQVQVGLGTQWRKDWALDYALSYRYGQGESQEIHWLKLGRSF